jgi:hypothetical protein
MASNGPVVQVQQGAFDELERRVVELELVSHEAFDFTALVERIRRLERPVDDRDAIAWEIGHAAALRGDDAHSNPFRKAR